MSQQPPRSREKSQLQPLGALMPSAVDFVWQAKARAEAARARAEGMVEQPVAKPTRCVDAERMVLAIAAKFGVEPRPVEVPPAREQAPARAPTPARTLARAPAPGRALHSGAYARPDDDTLGDATWLHFEFARVPRLSSAGLRTAAAGRERFRRGVWRAALAELLRRSPHSVSSPVGALVVAARQVQASGLDPRVGPRYCAASGWGVEAYRMVGVEGRIHQQGGCHCE